MRVRRARQRLGTWLLIVCLLASATAPATRATLHIDDAGSAVAFSVRIFWIHRLEGRFEHVHGEVERDTDGRARVDARIDVASAHMEHAGDTRRLLSPDFFDVARFPLIHFVSAPVSTAVLRHGGTLDGRLSMHGVTRPVRFHVQPNDCLQRHIDTCTLRVTGNIERTDFGMRKHRALVSNRVHLAIVIRLRRQP